MVPIVRELLPADYHVALAGPEALSAARTHADAVWGGGRKVLCVFGPDVLSVADQATTLEALLAVGAPPDTGTGRSGSRRAVEYAIFRSAAPGWFKPFSARLKQFTDRPGVQVSTHPFVSDEHLTKLLQAHVDPREALEHGDWQDRVFNDSWMFRDRDEAVADVCGTLRENGYNITMMRAVTDLVNGHLSISAAPTRPISPGQLAQMDRDCKSALPPAPAAEATPSFGVESLGLSDGRQVLTLLHVVGGEFVSKVGQVALVADAAAADHASILGISVGSSQDRSHNTLHIVMNVTDLSEAQRESLISRISASTTWGGRKAEFRFARREFPDKGATPLFAMG